MQCFSLEEIDTHHVSTACTDLQPRPVMRQHRNMDSDPTQNTWLRMGIGAPSDHTYNYLREIWLTCTITNLTRIHGQMSISPISL